MDVDIQFGDVEEAEPQRHLRPDQNKHFAVAAYESPESQELPVYVNLDVMRDMELHAASDKTVELGGVLLGGQFEDENGKPFVVISDSLRAEHYESTKGSFKFTHDTWSKISRERDEFSDDLQMVGWYHTHPDWGVFLSGMDMFICDNFFNRPLDVAYVIDPCRLDREFFEWTGNPSQRIRRIGGYYVTTSRFRQQELEFYTTQLESGFDMSNQQFGANPPPVVNIHEQRQSWQPMAILGMLSIQFLFLALVAWKMLSTERAVVANKELENTVRSQDVLIDKIVATLPSAPKNYRKQLEDQLNDNKQLSDTVKGLGYQVEKMEKVQLAADKVIGELKTKQEKTKKSLDKAKEKSGSQAEKITELRQKLKDSGGEVSIWRRWGIPIGIGAIVGLLVIAGYSATMSLKGQADDEDIDNQAADKESSADIEASVAEINDETDSPPQTRE